MRATFLVDLSIATHGAENETRERADGVTFSDNLETTMRLTAGDAPFRRRDRCGDSEDDTDEDMDDDDLEDEDDDDDEDDEDDEEEPETWQVSGAARGVGFPLKAGTA